MTEHKGHYFEVCISLDSELLAEQLLEIFTSEIMDFSGEAVEIADNQIIIRTSKDIAFINALLAHLRDFSANLAQINNTPINFTHSIAKKQNVDWIEEYRRGIKPLRCGRFYICPPWFVDNSSLDKHSADSANFECSQTSSLVSRSKFAENNESHTENPSVVDSANAESSTAQNPQSNNRSNGGVASSRFDTERAKIGLGDHSREVSYQNDSNEYPRTNCKQDNAQTINIILEPSLAFGTGHHASTFMCIEALDLLGANGGLKGKKLLDFGCGSGILALCVAKLGAEVDLCDIDELAIAESKKNFNNNNATISHIWNGSIKRESKGDLQDSHAKYDIITANIIASVLIEQKDNIASALKRGGIAIISGILDIYKDEVLTQFADFKPLEVKQKDEWICVILQKN